MDDNRDKRTHASSDDTGIDGEYHFVRPEQRLYEDAEFVPQDEATEVPNYYAPEEKKPREKAGSAHRSGTLKTACLCLVCALVGGLAGGFISWNAVKAASRPTRRPVMPPNPSSARPTSRRSAPKPPRQTRYTSSAAGRQWAFRLKAPMPTYSASGSASAVAGTGFVITADGYILTNYHVIESAQESGYKVSVLFKDKSSYEAKIVGFDEDNDVAVLKIDASDLTPATIGNSDDIAVGDSVFAIGNPLGELDFSMTSGRVSALDRSITTDHSSAPINMFQFDAAINSGNSGGPVYNESGEVIGIATAKVGSYGVEGLGFAIPINDAADIANELITKGYVSGKAYMGVNIDNRYTSMYAQYYNMPEGAYVYNVESGGCAEKSGLAAGDIITEVGGEAIGGYSDLNAAVKNFKAGQSTDIVVYRGGEYATLNITFDESKPESGTNGVSEFGASGIPKQ